MKNSFFEPNENFEKIISNVIDDKILELEKIPTGWTNIVFEVKTENDNYFFRFPRDNFWSKMIIKDCQFSQFIKGKTSFDTPDAILCYDNERPFSMHKKINGITLNSCMNEISSKDIKNIANDIAKFIYELNEIEVNNLPQGCDYPLIDFLDELAHVHFSDIDAWYHDFFKAHNQKNCLVHGDFNPGNILVNENHQMIGVLDFCFAGTGNPYADISRIIGRSPIIFRNSIINAYEKISNNVIDINLLESFIDMWSNIDKAYCNYIRNNNPDIILPDGL